MFTTNRYLKLLLACLLSCLAFFPAFAQKAGKPYQLPAGITPQDYFPSTVVFKWKENLRSQIQNPNQPPAPLQQLFSQFGRSSYQQKFLGTQKPAQPTDRRGRPMADLSLIYEWEFEPGPSIEIIINALLKTGLVEYAEPHFIDHLT